jgi:hypothetical protein
MERTSGPKPPPIAPKTAGRTEVRKTLRPGQRGTRKLLKIHGADLVCVRYRYDESAGERLKTVEIVVGRAPLKRPRRLPDSALVSVKVDPWEKPLQQRLKNAGARWDPALRLWRMRYDKALELGLRRRLLKALPRPESRHR